PIAAARPMPAVAPVTATVRPSRRGTSFQPRRRSSYPNRENPGATIRSSEESTSRETITGYPLADGDWITARVLTCPGGDPPGHRHGSRDPCELLLGVVLPEVGDDLLAHHPAQRVLQ